MILLIYPTFLCTAKDISDVFCEDVIQIGSNCTMMTPALDCTIYNYTIVNLSDAVEVDGGALTLLYHDIYKLNFTNISYAGNYVVRLCDGSVRGIIVESGVEVDYGTAVMLGMIGVALVLVMLMRCFKTDPDPEKANLSTPIIRLLLFFMSLYICLTALGWAMQIGYNENLDTGYMSPINASFETMTYFVWIIAAFVTIFFIWDVLTTLWSIIRRRKEKKNVL
jgi:hypothetical protein